MNRVMHHDAVLLALNELVRDSRLEGQCSTDGPCISAGGYWRDKTMNRPVKDLDIFIPHLEGGYKAVAAALSIYLESPVAPMNGSIQLAYSDVEVQAVFDTSVVDQSHRVPVQVIMLREGMNPLARVGSFDFGLCQLYSVGGDVLHTAAALHDEVNEQFTLVNCENQTEFNRSMRRFKRLTEEKYQGFPLRIPQEYHCFYAEWLATPNTFRSEINLDVRIS